jgi:hypothetical protein
MVDEDSLMPCETLNILCVSCLPVLSIFQLKIGHWSQACISYTIQLIRAITALQLIVVVSRSLVLMMRYAEVWQDIADTQR